MERAVRPPKAIRFGPFEIEVGTERLLRNGRPVKLQDQPLKILLLLLEQPGQIVSREEMRGRLWPRDSYGDFDNGLNVAVKKLRTALGDDTDHPQYIQTVPRRGYCFIGEVVGPTPAIVEQSALPETPQPSHANLRELAPVAIPSIPGHPETRSRRRHAAFAGLAGLLIAALAAVLLWRGRSITPGPSGTAKPAQSVGRARRSVAVLGFRNSSGRPEDAWLSTALSEMFSTELAAGDHLRLVSGEDVVHIHLARASLDVDSLSSGTAQQLRKALNADLIVSGSYAAIDSGGARQIRLDVRLQDAASGEILTEASDTGAEATLFQLVGHVGGRLRQKLDISGVSGEERTQVLASMPSNPQAGELYSKGLASLRAYDAMSAHDLLQQSIASDPSFPMAHSALSEAWSRLGYDRRAKDEAQKAYDLSAQLLPTERLRVQARYWEASGAWDKAAELYRILQSSFPDDPEYGVLLAHSLTRAGKGKDAVAMLEPLTRLRTLSQNGSGGGDDIRIELAIAEAHSALGDLESTLQAGEAAATGARAQGRLMLLAEALRVQGLTYENLGQSDKAIPVTEEARRIYEAAGDHFGMASVLEVQGNVLSDRGDLTGAIEKYRQELTIVREVGNKRGEASALNNMALVLNQQGDLERARAMWQEAETAFRELDDTGNIAVVLVNIGGVLKDQGDLASAKRRYEDALGLSKQIGDRSSTVVALNALGTVFDSQGEFAPSLKLLREASASDVAAGHGSPSSETLIDLGDVLQHRGDLSGAQTSYRQALIASQANGEKSWSAYALFGLGRLALLGADIAAARQNYDQAMQLRKELGETFTIAETEMALAELAIEEGHGAEAEVSLRRVRETFQKAGKQDDSIAATILLARALVSRGKAAEASRELETAPSPENIQNLGMRLSALIAKGRAQLAMGKTTGARAVLQSALRRAEHAGYSEYVFDARLALLECDPVSIQRSNGLRRLSQDAQQAGFVMVSEKASAL
jgi:eukaryotic-like serine/threonine-protein kinase